MEQVEKKVKVKGEGQGEKERRSRSEVKDKGSTTNYHLPTTNRIPVKIKTTTRVWRAFRTDERELVSSSASENVVRLKANELRDLGFRIAYSRHMGGWDNIALRRDEIERLRLRRGGRSA